MTFHTPGGHALPYAVEPDTLDAILRDLDALLSEPASVSSARLRYRRQALERAAEHGVALLAALDLPRIVTPEFEPVDREAVAAALDLSIAVLDALDGDPDIEPSLTPSRGFGGYGGWGPVDAECEPEHAEDDGTAEPTLGVPESNPFVGGENQARWARGSRQDGEGEAEAGYDLPEGDDERCGSEHDGRESDGGEPYLSVVEFDGYGDNWGRTGHCTSAWGTDVEAVNEGGSDCGSESSDPHWFARPIGPARPPADHYTVRVEMRATARRALEVRQRLDGPAPDRDPDTLYRSAGNVTGHLIWLGPVTRYGEPLKEVARA